MLNFHGTDTTALTGTETLIGVAHLVASAMRGKAARRNKLLTAEMQGMISKLDADTIAVSYLQFCDLLGRRSTQNNVLLRETKAITMVSRVRHGMRRLGLDVWHRSAARFGDGDVVLIISSKFKDNADLIPASFRERTSEISMAEIIADGQALNKIARAA